jgi:hypothetical protein
MFVRLARMTCGTRRRVSFSEIGAELGSPLLEFGQLGSQAVCGEAPLAGPVDVGVKLSVGVDAERGAAVPRGAPTLAIMSRTAAATLGTGAVTVG